MIAEIRQRIQQIRMVKKVDSDKNNKTRFDIEQSNRYQ